MKAAAAVRVRKTAVRVRKTEEEDLKAAVLDIIAFLGLLVLHIRPARRGTEEIEEAEDGTQRSKQRWETPVQGDGKGYPDLTIAGGHVMWRELKSSTGEVSVAQQRWLDRLEAAGGDVGVWRPEDLRSGRILRELKLCRRGLTKTFEGK